MLLGCRTLYVLVLVVRLVCNASVAMLIVCHVHAYDQGPS
jgi:hypothetical protein